jgi:hypothetical protein
MRRKWPVLTAAVPLAFGWAVADMASDGSFSVNYTGTGFAQWFGL